MPRAGDLTMSKSRLSAFLSLLLVFFSGSLVGAIAYRLYSVNTVLSGLNSPGPNRRPDPEEMRRRQVAEMRDRVKLDNRQMIEYNKILDEMREEFDQLHKKANSETQALREHQAEKVNAMLREEQRPLFAQLRAEHAERDRKRRQQQTGKK
jgi:hypothetical protein